mgnify:CR=1 FL=1
MHLEGIYSGTSALAMIGWLVAALVVLAGATHRHPRPLACTKMHIVFENAPHVPPLSYDACQ